MTKDTNEMTRSDLRRIETEEAKVNTLRQLLVEGEESGLAEYNLDSLITELDSE